jgi:predicted helicase
VNRTRIDFDELGVREVVELLDAAKMEAVILDFGDKNPLEDPVIHFYELFLKEYDARKRMQRGVFYTPRPVVSYIVRSVHELLKREFGLEDGLADTATWGQLAERLALEIPEGVETDDRFVTILDPAAGTGTFLVEAIDLIHRTLIEKWTAEGRAVAEVRDLWNGYVRSHLLPRLHGYELLMAPYAIAHLKVGLKLHETGYRFDTNERARIYLTNALEPAQDFSDRLEFTIPALAHEATAVNGVKATTRFTVVFGNPPYAGHSSNRGPWISHLVEEYYYLDGERLIERTSKWLQDDYVKFIRFVQALAWSSRAGVIGIISNHGFIDSPTFRGMRRSLLTSFGQLYILDLHGNLKKRERADDGSADLNVFDIQTGVAITLLMTGRFPVQAVLHGDLRGSRDLKYGWLSRSDATSTDWRSVHPAPSFFVLRPLDDALRQEFSQFWKTTDIFPVNGVGMTTARDRLVIDFDRDVLIDRVERFRDSQESNVEICESFEIPLKKGWNIDRSRRLLIAETDVEKNIVNVTYRPFDQRVIFYHDSLVWRTVRAVMMHMVNDGNIALAVGRAGQVVGQGEWNLAYTSRYITDFNLFRRGGNNLSPLYLKDELSGMPTPNLADAWLRDVADGCDFSDSDAIVPRDVLGYIYALLYSPRYRERYAEFLKIDFPRIPIPGSRAVFEELSRVGRELVALHVGDGPESKPPIAAYSGPKDPTVGRIEWSDNTVLLDASRSRRMSVGHTTIGFHNVLEQAWTFEIGGYQVCHKWLKDRKGRRLTDDDIGHYQRIVSAISETIQLMAEVDEVIEAHGGWPGAFVTSTSEVAS